MPDRFRGATQSSASDTKTQQLLIVAAAAAFVVHTSTYMEYVPEGLTINSTYEQKYTLSPIYLLHAFIQLALNYCCGGRFFGKCACVLLQ